MNKIILLLMLILTSCKSVKNKQTVISGVFLFEVNIPNNFHAYDDVIVQQHLIVHYEKQNLKNINFDNLYSNKIIDLHDNDNYSKEIYSDSILKNDLIISLQKCMYDYENKNNNYKYITKNEQCYIPFKADILVTYTGYKKWLIPKTLNYKCCFSNEEKLMKTYKIDKILNFKIIQDW